MHNNHRGFSTDNPVHLICMLFTISLLPLTVFASECGFDINPEGNNLLIDSMSIQSLDHANERIVKKAKNACGTDIDSAILDIGVAEPVMSKRVNPVYRVYACICCNNDPQCRSAARQSPYKEGKIDVAESEYQQALLLYSSDMPTALSLLRKAAQNGHPRSQEELGMYYFTNEGKSRDLASAYVWLSIAQMHGEHIGDFFPNELVKQMATEELMTAQEKLINCLSSSLEGCH